MKLSELRQLIKEELKGVIKEASLDSKEQVIVNDIKDEMSDILKTMDSELQKASKTANEGILTVASIAIALPAILGLISKFGKAAGNIVNKVLGKKPTQEDAYQQWMAKLGKIADELHHLYMAPIEGIVKKFVKDPSKAKNISNGIFHVIVAVFLIASGVTAVKALQAKSVSLASLEGALTAVKSGELNTYINKLFI